MHFLWISPKLEVREITIDLLKGKRKYFNSDEASIIKGLSLGGDDYIVKPFSIHEVNARI